MKRVFYLPIVAAAFAATAAFAADVNVHVTIGHPGYYGRLDLGGYPAPRLVYAEPRIVERVVVREPVYLRVPVTQQRNWPSYCARYGACNRPVYFVQDTWYNDVYVPRYRIQHYQSSGSTGVRAPYRSDTYRTDAYRTDAYRTDAYRSDTYRSAAAREAARQDVRTRQRIQANANANANTQANAKVVEKQAKAAEKQAKADRKAAEKQAKEDRKAAQKQAKAAEKQAKEDRKG